MSSFYKKKKAKKRFRNASFSNDKVKAISIAIDIRKSTTMYNNLKAEKTIKIIKPFVEECYIILNARKIFDKFVYAGDGLIAVCYVNNDNELFNKVFEAAIDINCCIKDYQEWVKEDYKYGLKVGIGIAFDANSYKEKIQNMPKKCNNILLVGDSISKSTKLCAIMPDKIETENYNISASKSFHSKLSEENQKKFKNKSKKKYYSDAVWKS